MPAGRSRGFTHDKPTSPQSAPPRLFVKARAANAALKCWLKGEWHQESVGGYDSEGDDLWGEPPATPPPDRVAADMEVVPVELLVIHTARDPQPHECQTSDPEAE
jgi:hypothetical protein